MGCVATTSRVTVGRTSPKPVPLGQRVGDRERDDVQEVLGLGFALGYLDVEELEVRTSRALTATTGADLARLTGDLPVAELRERDPARRAAQRRAARLGVRVHLAAYLLVSTLLLGVWLLVGLSGGEWFPWPAGPVLGWGIGVASHAVPVHRSLRQRQSRRPGRHLGPPPFRSGTEPSMHHALVERTAPRSFTRVNVHADAPLPASCSPEVHHRFGGSHPHPLLTTPVRHRPGSPDLRPVVSTPLVDPGR